MNKGSIKFFKSFFSATEPLLEGLITNVCNELGQPEKAEEMISKFLAQDKKKFTKILNQKSNTNKRRKTPYSMFLADKEALNKLKEEFPDCNLSELNKKKGEYWRNVVKQTPEIMAMYKKRADEANLGKKEEQKLLQPVVETVDETITLQVKEKKTRKPRTKKNKQ